jgi:Protein of unknown function (DUF2852)
MSDTYHSTPATSGGIAGWFRRAEAWLDDRGKAAWIIAMVLGFVIFWPIGLALLAYMIWSKRMFGRTCANRTNRHSPDHSRSMGDFARNGGFRSTGNAAFDAYKSETLRRLQDEQEAFESFLDRLRTAKDKTEFDAFMSERARKAADLTAPAPQGNDSPASGY